MAANRGVWQDGLVAKRPRDPNQLAKLIVDIATGEAKDTVSDSKRMAAGLSDHVWSMEEIAMLTDAAYAPKKRGS